MAAPGDQKWPAGQRWLTLLPVPGVVLGGLAGYLAGRLLDFEDWEQGLAGVAGVILGFVTGLGLIAFGRVAPRPTPGTPPPAGSAPGQAQGENATGILPVPGIYSALSSGWARAAQATGLLPVRRMGSAFSFGQRVFAFVLWSVVGVVLIYCCFLGAIELFLFNAPIRS